MIMVTGARRGKLIFIPKDNIGLIEEYSVDRLDEDLRDLYPKKFTKITLKQSTRTKEVRCIETPEEIACQARE